MKRRTFLAVLAGVMAFPTSILAGKKILRKQPYYYRIKMAHHIPKGLNAIEMELWTEDFSKTYHYNHMVPMPKVRAAKDPADLLSRERNYAATYLDKFITKNEKRKIPFVYEGKSFRDYSRDVPFFFQDFSRRNMISDLMRESMINDRGILKPIWKK